MLKRALQHILLTSSLIHSLLICGNRSKSCLTRHGSFLNTRNSTFPNQELTKTPRFHSNLNYSTLKKYRLEEKARKEFRNQGITPFELKKSEMEESSQQGESIFKLPPEIKGMKKLNKSAFETKMKLPCVIVDHTDLHRLMYLLKRFIFKMQKFNSVQDYDEANVVHKSDELKPRVVTTGRSDGNFNCFPSKIYQTEGYAFKHNSKSKVILLNPAHVEKFEDFGEDNLEALASANLTVKNFAYCEATLTYDNFSAEEILKAILPSMLSSFTSVGHIVQCNLREEHNDFKFIIGQVLLDKVSTCETVVSKTHSIDNTYRNFEMELLAGKPNMITVHRENGCQFKMDFSKVYWNSRLSTEHQRLVNEIRKGDILLDVFAGVGPFSIPAAWKGARVIANDLNPDSVHWLAKSIELNKRLIQIPITIVNKDAKDFIQTDVRAHLRRWIDTKRRENNLASVDPEKLKAKKWDLQTPRVKIVMNLPATAIEYVKYLRVLTNEEFDALEAVGPLPLLYLYTFQPKMDLGSKASMIKIAGAAELFEAHGLKFDEDTMFVSFVRNVAPNKNMYKLKVPLTREFLVKSDLGDREKERERGGKREGEHSKDREVKKARLE